MRRGERAGHHGRGGRLADPADRLPPLAPGGRRAGRGGRRPGEGTTRDGTAATAPPATAPAVTAASSATGSAVAAAAEVVAAASTSSRVIRPPGPDPVSAYRSTPEVPGQLAHGRRGERDVRPAGVGRRGPAAPVRRTGRPVAVRWRRDGRSRPACRDTVGDGSAGGSPAGVSVTGVRGRASAGGAAAGAARTPGRRALPRAVPDERGDPAVLSGLADLRAVPGGRLGGRGSASGVGGAAPPAVSIAMIGSPTSTVCPGSTSSSPTVPGERRGQLHRRLRRLDLHAAPG